MTNEQLYRHERRRWIRRRDAVIERCRKTLQEAEDRWAAQRKRSRQAKGAGVVLQPMRRPRVMKPRTEFKCGHPRTPENSYLHKAGARRRNPFTECRACQLERYAKRNIGRRKTA